MRIKSIMLVAAVIEPTMIGIDTLVISTGIRRMKNTLCILVHRKVSTDAIRRLAPMAL